MADNNPSGLDHPPMKAISLWQPWASLVALGTKTIETRSWATRYRGPLAIHAAKTTKGILDLPGDCEGKEEAGWRYGYIGDYQATYCYRTSDEGTRGDTELVDLRGPGIGRHDMPLGAIVATCTLIDCVPILDVGDELTMAWQRHVAPTHNGHLQLWEGRTADNGPMGRPTWRLVAIEDQRPYGDFRPGRWAWLLDDITPVDPPLPARGRQQLFQVDPEEQP